MSTKTKPKGAGNEDLTGKCVLFKPEVFREEYAYLAGIPFLVDFGNGCFPNSRGGKIYGIFANGMEDQLRREYVREIIPTDPVLVQIAKFHKEGRKKYSDQQPRNEQGSFSINFAEQHTFAYEYLVNKLREAGYELTDTGYKKL